MFINSNLITHLLPCKSTLKHLSLTFIPNLWCGEFISWFCRRRTDAEKWFARSTTINLFPSRLCKSEPTVQQDQQKRCFPEASSWLHWKQKDELDGPLLCSCRAPMFISLNDIWHMWISLHNPNSVILISSIIITNAKLSNRFSYQPWHMW